MKESQRDRTPSRKFSHLSILIAIATSRSRGAQGPGPTPTPQKFENQDIQIQWL